MTLYLGDIINPGTPGGIGLIKIGGIFEVRIDGIRTLRNPIKGYPILAALKRRGSPPFKPLGRESKGMKRGIPLDFSDL
jgi:hypothetical protein